MIMAGKICNLAPTSGIADIECGSHIRSQGHLTTSARELQLGVMLAS